MGKHGKKLDEKTKADLIRLSKDYSIRYVAQHLGVHESTVRRHIELEAEEKAMASRSFDKHSDDLTCSFKRVVSNLVSHKELLSSTLAHLQQEFPEFAHLNTWQDVSKEDVDKCIFEKMELLADSRIFRFCAKCPICQSIKRRQTESSRGVVQLLTNSRS